MFNSNTNTFIKLRIKIDIFVVSMEKSQINKYLSEVGFCSRRS